MQENHPQPSQVLDPASLKGRAMQLLIEESNALCAAADLRKPRENSPEFTAAIQKVQAIHAERVRVDKLVLAQSRQAIDRT